MLLMFKVESQFFSELICTNFQKEDQIKDLYIQKQYKEQD